MHVNPKGSDEESTVKQLLLCFFYFQHLREFADLQISINVFSNLWFHDNLSASIWFWPLHNFFNHLHHLRSIYHYTARFLLRWIGPETAKKLTVLQPLRVNFPGRFTCCGHLYVGWDETWRGQKQHNHLGLSSQQLWKKQHVQGQKEMSGHSKWFISAVVVFSREKGLI